jgi:hypothetical protein
VEDRPRCNLLPDGRLAILLRAVAMGKGGSPSGE